MKLKIHCILKINLFFQLRFNKFSRMTLKVLYFRPTLKFNVIQTLVIFLFTNKVAISSK